MVVHELSFHPGIHERSEFCGIYSTDKKAEEGITEFKRDAYYSDSANGEFVITEHIVDENLMENN